MTSPFTSPQQPTSNFTTLRWDQASLLAALNNIATQGSRQEWYVDLGAYSHMTSDHGNLHCCSPFNSSSFHSVIIGNGSFLPITHTSTHSVPTKFHPLTLRNVLVVPHIIKNLISIRRLTFDNHCPVKFDPFGFSIKDIPTRTEILRCNSSGGLYSMSPPSQAFQAAATSTDLWHRTLGHPGRPSMSSLSRSCLIPYCHINSTICQACQVGHHVQLPFATLRSITLSPFELFHYDLWMSPIFSHFGFYYYLIVIDDFSHYMWTFPLRRKSDVHATLMAFHVYITT